MSVALDPMVYHNWCFWVSLVTHCVYGIYLPQFAVTMTNINYQSQGRGVGRGVALMRHFQNSGFRAEFYIKKSLIWAKKGWAPSKSLKVLGLMKPRILDQDYSHHTSVVCLSWAYISFIPYIFFCFAIIF